MKETLLSVAEIKVRNNLLDEKKRIERLVDYFTGNIAYGRGEKISTLDVLKAYHVRKEYEQKRNQLVKKGFGY